MYDLIEELKVIAQVLEENGLDYALCGGLAVSYHTEPRATIDIDLVVDPSQLEKIVEVLAKAGFEKHSVLTPADQGRMNIQRLLKFKDGEQELLMLDLCMPDKAGYPSVWKNRERITIEDAEIWLISKQGLIEMKKARDSKKDQADIDALEAGQDE